jgi:hypothetical protein
MTASAPASCLPDRSDAAQAGTKLRGVRRGVARDFRSLLEVR